MSQTTPPFPKILVFDSGLGGLSIVGELTRADLGVDVDYLADTAFFPYGEKADDALLSRVPDLIARAVAATQADLVIVACNTASTLALEAIRQAAGIPVIGVVPAIKPAAALTKTGVIGLLATPNTITRPYTDQLIKDFAQGVHVIRHGAVGLAGAAEAMLCGQPLDESVIEASVNGLFNQNKGEEIDVVVLACTHYPHLKAQLQSFAPRLVTWVDSGRAIAARARDVLKVDTHRNPLLKTGMTTGGYDEATRTGLLRWGFEKTRHLISKR
jgi:glutamate racemase